MRLVSLVLAVLVTAPFSHTANCEDPVKRSVEFQVLDRFVGTWDLALTAKPRDGQPVTSKSSEMRRWSLGGKFVQFENLQTENPDEPHFHMLLTYDSATKTYPGVMMVGTSRSLIDGTWNPENNTMTLNGKSPADGITFVFKARFLDADHCESTGVLKNAKGETILELTQSQTRRAK